MKGTAFALLAAVLLSLSTVHARGQALPRHFDIDDDTRTVGFIWSASIAPGDDLLMIKNFSKQYRTTFYTRFIFLGVNAGSAMVGVSKSSQEEGKRNTASPDTAIYIERGKDGSFHLVPSELKGIGELRFQADDAAPGEYTVTLNRRSSQR